MNCIFLISLAGIIFIMPVFNILVLSCAGTREQELKKLDKKTNVLISNKYLNTVGKYLKDNKFESIYDCSSLLENFDLSDFYKKKKMKSIKE